MRKVTDYGLPQIDLKRGDFVHVVPDEHKIELCITWKVKDAERDFINPVRAFSIEENGKYFKVVNRNHHTVYSYPIKELRSVIIIPMEA